MCTSVVQLRSPTDPGPSTIELHSAEPRKKSRGSRLADALKSQTTSLELPQDKTIKLSVISGSSEGMVRELSRPLMTIGRSGGGADIEIEDPEVSAIHCAVEVRRDAILLHDLRSRNGTYVDNARVFAARLEQMSTFRIGSSILRVKTISKEDGDPSAAR